MSETGLLVKTDGTHTRITWEPGTEYETIKAALGGVMLELVTFYAPEGHVFAAYIDEEGKLKADPVCNTMGTAMWLACYGPTDVIIGDMLLVAAEPDDEGNTLGLSEADLRQFEDILSERFDLEVA
jgi:hypothetical protein